MRSIKIRKAFYLSLQKALTNKGKPKYVPMFLWKYIVRIVVSESVIDRIKD